MHIPTIFKTAALVTLLASCASTSEKNEPRIDAQATALCRQPAPIVKSVRIRAQNTNDSASKKGTGIWLDTPYGNNIFITNAHNLEAAATKKPNGDVIKAKAYKAVYAIDHKGKRIKLKTIAVRQVRTFSSTDTGFKTLKMADIAILESVKPIPAAFKATKHKLATTNKNGIVSFDTYSSLSTESVSKYRTKNKHVQRCTNSIHGQNALFLYANMPSAYSGESGTAILDSNGHIQGLLTMTGRTYISKNVSKIINGRKTLITVAVEGRPTFVQKNVDGSIEFTYDMQKSIDKTLNSKLYGVVTNHSEIRKFLDETYKNK